MTVCGCGGCAQGAATGAAIGDCGAAIELSYHGSEHVRNCKLGGGPKRVHDIIRNLICAMAAQAAEMLGKAVAAAIKCQTT